MYLADTDIRSKLNEINIVTDDPDYPFNAEEQVQPCSLDLRLSNVFWSPQKSKTIDLRKSALLELEPMRYWRKKVLGKNECLTLKPQQLLIGRTYEKFTIPVDCAGKIEGRSSFARMGLSIHCTGDFINPGYRGHMPIELFNCSPNPIKIFPHLPICQLMLIKLTREPTRKYGQQELQSKYMDDDGAPQYWWRDKRIMQLQQRFSNIQVDLHVQEDIFRKIGIQEPETIERFEHFVLRLAGVQKENAETLLDLFSKKEDKFRFKEKMLTGISLVTFPFLASASVGIIVTQRPYVYLHYFIWIVTFLSFFPFLKALYKPAREYLGTRELEKLRRVNP